MQLDILEAPKAGITIDPWINKFDIFVGTYDYDPHVSNVTTTM